ncbi:aminotransferase class V-fold PLP-dependent enzyme [Odoribacter sp. OttesenSCG-928-L07]|nr:aminotransferase class V-fold PLP-dependent enzyme [Odoribacter sp. OttesenSCG-928-L07]MDL2239338.1 aminotransferase class V-fold PLP-dependent enzyme [Bacteroidales bacterium OttesenSCG-928-L14]MDL2240383.1 aminotransferase class V-fold PLP-dependent enzyme [Bacteroidales bacterium OttesenSCG-928-K22]
MKTYRYPFFPGPTSVSENVLHVGLTNFGSADVEPEFLDLYKKCVIDLQKILNTKSDVVIMTGEGMLVLWSGLKSCLEPGDKVLAISTGIFGTGIGEMAKSIGCEVKTIEFPYDCSFEDHFLIEKTIAEFKPKMITAVHCETPSGILNDLTILGKLKKMYKVPLFYVDAVASVGAVHINADKHNIDLCLGGSQKALSVPANSCFMSVSDKAWSIIEEVGYQGYDALLPFKDVKTTGFFPYTPSWVNIAQLYQSTQNIFVEGFENVVKRHENCSKNVIKKLKEAGIKLFPRDEKYSSPTVTAAYIPDGFTWEEYDKMMREKGIVFGGNYGELEGKVFRIGHMGTQTNFEELCLF